MPETPPSLLDRFLRSGCHDVRRTGEITRDYADKMLLAALQEAQSVVRSYDTKAQIVGVGYILALNLVLHFGDLLPTRAPLGPLFFAVVWGVVIMPILQFGQVLYPSRRRAEKELLAKTSCGSEQRRLLCRSRHICRSQRLRPTGSEVRLDLGACRRIAQDISHQDHQAGTFPPRPDDGRRVFHRTRRRAVCAESHHRLMRNMTNLNENTMPPAELMKQEGEQLTSAVALTLTLLFVNVGFGGEEFWHIEVSFGSFATGLNYQQIRPCLLCRRMRKFVSVSRGGVFLFRVGFANDPRTVDLVAGYQGSQNLKIAVLADPLQWEIVRQYASECPDRLRPNWSSLLDFCTPLCSPCGD